MSTSAQARVVDIRPKRGDDDDFILIVERPYPRVPPGQYEAVSKSIERGHYQAREYLTAHFDVFEGEMVDGVILAHEVPGYFNLPRRGQKIGPSSKLARWIQLLEPGTRLDRVPARTLLDKVWRVRIVDVVKDARQSDLPAGNQYSKVDAVLARIA